MPILTRENICFHFNTEFLRDFPENNEEYPGKKYDQSKIRTILEKKKTSVESTSAPKKGLIRKN